MYTADKRELRSMMRVFGQGAVFFRKRAKRLRAKEQPLESEWSLGVADGFRMCAKQVAATAAGRQQW